MRSPSCGQVGASQQGAAAWGRVALNALVASTALLLMLLLRKRIHKPMCGATPATCAELSWNPHHIEARG